MSLSSIVSEVPRDASLRPNRRMRIGVESYTESYTGGTIEKGSNKVPIESKSTPDRDLLGASVFDERAEQRARERRLERGQRRYLVSEEGSRVCSKESTEVLLQEGILTYEEMTPGKTENVVSRESRVEGEEGLKRREEEGAVDGEGVRERRRRQTGSGEEEKEWAQEIPYAELKQEVMREGERESFNTGERKREEMQSSMRRDGGMDEEAMWRAQDMAAWRAKVKDCFLILVLSVTTLTFLARNGIAACKLFVRVQISNTANGAMITIPDMPL